MATDTGAPGFSSSNTSYEFDLSLFNAVNSYVRHERFDELLALIDIDGENIDGERRKPVNLMNDPVLNIVISANKTWLAVNLIKKVKSVRPLFDENIYGDTALHTAAVEGNDSVAWVLLMRESQLVEDARESDLRFLIGAVKNSITTAKELLERESQLLEAVAAVEGNITVAEALLQRESQLVEAAREPRLMEAIAAIKRNITEARALLPRKPPWVQVARESPLVEAIATVERNITVAEELLQKESQPVEAAREPQLVEAIVAVKGNITKVRALLQRESQLEEVIVAIKENIIVAEELLQRESQLVEAIPIVKESITMAEVLLQRESQLVEAIAAVKRNITEARALLQRESQLVEAIAIVEKNIIEAEALLQRKSQVVEPARERQLVQAIAAVKTYIDMARAKLQKESQLVEAITIVEKNITVAEVLLQRESQPVEAVREPQLVEAIAAIKGNITLAKALLQRKLQQVKAVNKKGETAMHKAAMYGHRYMFFFLESNGGMASARKNDGSNMLHCAIMGNAPELALEIAEHFPELILSRDEAGLTPLQLIVTIPSFLRSPLVSGRLKRFLYKLIPIKVEESIPARNARADEEAGGSVDIDRDEGSYGWTRLIARVRYSILVILKQVYRPMKYLEKEKERYMAAMKLVEYLAKETSFDFYAKGYSRELNPTIFDAMRSHSDLQYTRRDDDKMLKHILNEADRLPSRWMEPPLIIAAELGLDDFVRKILKVCPQSAIYLNSKGRNVMQVAIQSGHEKVIRIISEMLQGNNPVLPSCLPSMLDNKTRNTILHLAAENSPAKEGDALQLHDELVWFEMVKKIVPRELVYSRNKEEKTAHELFTNNHKRTLEDCQKKLVELGKVCAGLVVAVVFTSGFSIPTHKDDQSNKLAYTIFTHAYLFGFGCAVAALVLFLWLILTPYQERYFRRAIARQFFLACLSFVLALVGFLVSFACNFVLQIYSGQKMQKMQLVKLFLELLLFPLVCIAILFFSGAELVPSFSRYWK